MSESIDNADSADGGDSVDDVGSVDERIRLIASMRVRKLLHWMRVRGEVPNDTVLRELISQGVWRSTKMRLYEWLGSALCVPSTRAIALTVEAIEKGYEDEKRY